MATDPWVQAGANVRANTQNLNFRELLNNAARDATHTAAAIVSPPASAVAYHVLPALANFMSGVQHGAPAPAKVAAAAPQVKAAAKPAAAAAEKPSAAQTPAGVPSFDQMMQAYASSNGGSISLREMSALADISAKTSATHHVPTIADIAGQRALDLGDQLTNFKLDHAKSAGDKGAYEQAVQDQLDRYERIARARAIDPVTAAQLGN